MIRATELYKRINRNWLALLAFCGEPPSLSYIMSAPTSATTSLVMSLNVTNPDQAYAFYQEAFAAKLLKEVSEEDGYLIHAEMEIGTSLLLLSSEVPEMGAITAQTAGASPTLHCLYSDNVDPLFEAAVAAGAEVLIPLANHYWGKRGGMVRDPFGYRWWLAQVIEDISPEEHLRRARAQRQK